jgi:hypothetical protein
MLLAALLAFSASAAIPAGIFNRVVLRAVKD